MQQRPAQQSVGMASLLLLKSSCPYLILGQKNRRIGVSRDMKPLVRAWHLASRAREPLRTGRRRRAAAEDAVKVAGEDGRPALGVEVKLLERLALGGEHGVLPASWKERGV